MSTQATLDGKRIAMLVEDEFEDREVTGPLDALRAAGATVRLVGATAGTEYKGKRGHATVKADVAAGAVKIGDFDALVIPGGHAPDKMRMRHAMVDLAAVRSQRASEDTVYECVITVLHDAGYRIVQSWRHQLLARLRQRVHQFFPAPDQLRCRRAGIQSRPGSDSILDGSNRPGR